MQVANIVEADWYKYCSCEQSNQHLSLELLQFCGRFDRLLRETPKRNDFEQTQDVYIIKKDLRKHASVCTLLKYNFRLIPRPPKRFAICNSFHPLYPEYIGELGKPLIPTTIFSIQPIEASCIGFPIPY
jgi:hypothetical protein